MADFKNLTCDDEARRAKIREHETLNGIDYVEVVVKKVNDHYEYTLKVHFIPKTAATASSLSTMLTALDGATDKVTVEGGIRVQNIEVTSVKQDTKDTDVLVVRVSEPGDFSTYTLKIDYAWHPGDGDPSTATPKLDPAYAQCDFSFKAGCPSRIDCKTRQVCPTESRAEPLIDYMAKDYASFRQALIDLIPTLAPEWKERLEADLSIALVELLAYVGDHLSYYQDAVANEAYLETARQRISVRRHARLIDYRMHDGASARVFIHVKLDKDTPDSALPKKTRILTRIEKPLSAQAPPYELRMPPHKGDLSDVRANEALAATGAVFETFKEVRLSAALNEIAIHTWGNAQCCLPRGTTTADLMGDLTQSLARGDFLLFEEVKGPTTGLGADADPTHRQIVRLTGVVKVEDPLPPDKTSTAPLKLTRVTWGRTDALTFPLCVSAKKDAVTSIKEVSVARGNLVLADHGREITEWYPSKPLDLTNPTPSSLQTGNRSYRFRLKEAPLSFRIPMPKDNGTLTPVKTLLHVDLHKAKPQVVMATLGSSKEWEAVTPHLLDSKPFDHHFVVETDNDGRGHVRFGDGAHGRHPTDGAYFKVVYRVGVGAEGNVGADSLCHAIKPASFDPTKTKWPNNIDAIYNPLPAWGGTDPESMAQVKQLAPAAMHATQYRAVTEADYARVAAQHPEVQKAVATFRWTGSWHTVFCTVDPVGRNDVPAALERRVKNWITSYTMSGYDLEIDPPTFVPLEVEIDVCVLPNHFRAHVEQALLAALSNRTQHDGTRGFFHPDNFTFGQPLYLSKLYAAIEAVEGIDSAVVKRFVRLTQPDPEPNRPATKKNLDQSYVSIGRLEIVRLDNDPSLPENGVLRLNMLGGK